jgi:hypothetical protein
MSQLCEHALKRNYNNVGCGDKSKFFGFSDDTMHENAFPLSLRPGSITSALLGGGEEFAMHPSGHTTR